MRKIDPATTIRGERRHEIRMTLGMPSRNEAEEIAFERAVAARLDASEPTSSVEPIRALTARAALALQDLGSEHWASYVNALLPVASYAAAEAISRSPERLASFVAGWIAHLESSVAETAALAETAAHFPSVHSGGIGRQLVLGHRDSISYFPEYSSRPIDAEDENHYARILLGMSDAAAAAWTARFVEVLRAADAAIPLAEAPEHRKWMKKASDQLDAFPPHFADSPAFPSYREEQLAEAEKSWQDRHLEGITIIDHALEWLRFGPNDRLAPGFDEGRYVTAVSGVLMAALDGVSGAATLKVVIDASLGFAEDARRWGADLPAASRAAAEKLDRAARATAARLGLELRSNQGN